jgi:LysR family glycine cleavage system transcriptional activator
MKLSHLNGLRALEATLRLGSFSAAAGELGVTPAAVGQRVRVLEDYLGRPLFTRTSAGAAPTAEARQVLPVLNTGFAAIADGLERLRADQPARPIRVTMPESFAENWFSWVLAGFSAAHPAADLRLDATNRDVAFPSDTLDFAIRYGGAPGKGVTAHRLFGDSVQPVCAPDFAGRHDLHPGRGDLTGVPLIHVMNRTGDPGWVGFDGWGRAFGVDPATLTHGVRFSRTGSGLQGAIAGQGLVMAGLVEAFHALWAGRLVLPFGPARRVTTHYAYRLINAPDAPQGRLHRAFHDWVLESATGYRQDRDALLAALTEGG